jgi:hypothetical protein
VAVKGPDMAAISVSQVVAAAADMLR